MLGPHAMQPLAATPASKNGRIVPVPLAVHHVTPPGPSCIKRAQAEAPVEAVGCSYIAQPRCSYHAHQHQQSRRLATRMRAGGMGFPPGMDANDPYMNLFKSPIFQNSVIVKEFFTMMDDLMSLAKMQSKFPDFDTTGKRMYLERMRDAGERYELFIKRLELSSSTDEAAREFLRTTNAQMLNGGFTLQIMFDGLRGSLVQYEHWVIKEEEAIAAGPQQHQAFLKGFREAWRQTALGAMDTNELSKSIDPQVLMVAQQDPQFWLCIKEISGSPSPDVMARWMDNPRLGPLVAEMARSMLNQQAKRQA